MNNIYIEQLYPVVELISGADLVHMSPHTWKKFVYFRGFMNNSTSSNRSVTLELEQEFRILIRFLNGTRPTTYFEAVSLREQTLIFGLEPTSDIATQVSATIAEVINVTAHLTTTWDLLQSGWGEFVHDKEFGFGTCFVRTRNIASLLLIALLPLSDFTIDILNSETLIRLKQQDDLTEREHKLKKCLQGMFQSQ